MITNKNNSFLVPVIFVSAEELEVTIENNPYIPNNIYSSSRQYTNFSSNNKVGVSAEELSMIKSKIKKQLEYKFYQLRDIAKHLTPDQIEVVHLSIFKALFNANVDNIPCLNVIKTKSINGMTYNQVLDMHINKFKEMYNLHNNMFNSNREYSAKTSKITDEQLMVKLNQIIAEIHLIFKNISSTIEKISIEQALEIYEMILQILISLHCGNVNCFNGINEANCKNIAKMYLDTLKETFYLHVHLLHCE